MQQSAAAGAGVSIAWLMGHSAWPVVILLALLGGLTLLLWLTTRAIRHKAVKF